MSAGLLTKAHVARWLGKRPAEIGKLIELDGLPAVPVPSESGTVDRITLHGLWRWCTERARGGKFMSVDELAHELELCAAGADEGGPSAEQSLLGEMAALSEVIVRNSKQGLDATRSRRALRDIFREWEALQAA